MTKQEVDFIIDTYDIYRRNKKKHAHLHPQLNAALSKAFGRPLTVEEVYSGSYPDSVESQWLHVQLTMLHHPNDWWNRPTLLSGRPYISTIQERKIYS